MPDILLTSGNTFELFVLYDEWREVFFFFLSNVVCQKLTLVLKLCSVVERETRNDTHHFVNYRDLKMNIDSK